MTKPLLLSYFKNSLLQTGAAGVRQTITALQLKLQPTFFLVLSLLTLNVKAQTINYTATPGTAAVELVPYSGSIQATISNNDPLTFSAPILPAWLQLSLSGSGNATTINNTSISSPGGVARDEQGNYYVVQYSSTGIYKVLPDGSSSLWITREGTQNYGAIIVDNYLYVSDFSGTGIIRYNVTQDNPTAEVVYSPRGILSMTYKDGYLYGADYAYNKIIRIDLSDLSSSEYITTGVEGCFGLGFDPQGDLLIASYSYKKIMKYVPGTGIVDLITDMTINPSDVKIDAQGYLYVSSYGGKIRKYTPDYSSYTEVSENIRCWGMTLTPTGTLIFGDIITGNVYALQTGVSLTGTPSHEDVGEHPVKITVTNGTVSKDHEFVITVTDPNPPVASSYTPAANTEDVPLSTPSLSITFSETVVKGTGNIYLKRTGDNATLETIDVNSSQVTINDKTVTIALNNRLPSRTDIYINIDAGGFADVNGNDFAGINNYSDWFFYSVEQTQDEQTITMAASRVISYGSADYDPGATASSELPVTYSASDETIAAIVDGKVRVKKAGTVTITATQAGNDDFLAAEPIEQELTINPAALSVKADNKSRNEGEANPTFSFTYSGFVNGDEASDLTVAPQATTDATVTSAPGKYEITLSGASSPNYSITYQTGELTVLSVDKKALKAWSNGSELQIRIYSKVAQKVSLTLFSLNGQAIQSKNHQLSVGQNTIIMPIGGLAPQLYLLNAHAEQFKESVKVKIH